MLSKHNVMRQAFGRAAKMFGMPLSRVCLGLNAALLSILASSPCSSRKGAGDRTRHWILPTKDTQAEFRSSTLNAPGWLLQSRGRAFFLGCLACAYDWLKQHLGLVEVISFSCLDLKANF